MKKILIVFILLLLSHITYADTALNYNAEELKKIIDKQVIEELQKKDSNISKFSRVPPAPKERRARIIDQQFKKDQDGLAFFRFSIDERYRIVNPENPESAWVKDKYQACLYPQSKEIWFKSSDNKYYPISLLFGNFEASKNANTYKCNIK